MGFGLLLLGLGVFGKKIQGSFYRALSMPCTACCDFADPWADANSRSALGFRKLYQRSSRLQNYGSTFRILPGGSGLGPKAPEGIWVPRFRLALMQV